MSEFMHKTEIVTLKQSNSELKKVISDLKAEIHELNCEIERLKEDGPNDIDYLEEKINECQIREDEFKNTISSISEDAKKNKNKYEVIKKLLSIFGPEDSIFLESIIENYYNKKNFSKIIIFFLLGILLTLSVWQITNYLETENIYNLIMNKIISIILTN